MHIFIWEEKICSGGRGCEQQRDGGPRIAQVRAPEAAAGVPRRSGEVLDARLHRHLPKLVEFQGGEVLVWEVKILVNVKAFQAGDERAQGGGREGEQRGLNWRGGGRQEERCPVRRA